MKNSNQFSNNFKTFPAIVMVDSVPSENTNEKQAISFLIILNISLHIVNIFNIFVDF
jgi:hypothetical protein